MADAFADSTRLGTELKRVFDAASLDAVELMLEDASAHLRGIIGFQVWPQDQVQFTVPLHIRLDRRIKLPLQPVVSVDQVSIEGQVLDVADDGVYVYLDWPSLRGLIFPCGRPPLCTVKFTAGYADPPAELVTWTCVLASQALSAVEELKMLGGGGVSSIGIDDYRKSWANGAEGVGFSIPERIEEQLRERYGTTVTVVKASG